MTIQCEQTPPSLVVPDLDLVVITTGDKQGLGRVEIDSSNGAVVFFEAINESSCPVIPELDSGGVEGDENPWSVVLKFSTDAPSVDIFLAGSTYRWGWNAIPLAPGDLNRNCMIENG